MSLKFNFKINKIEKWAEYTNGLRNIAIMRKSQSSQVSAITGNEYVN